MPTEWPVELYGSGVDRGGLRRERGGLSRVQRSPSRPAPIHVGSGRSGPTALDFAPPPSIEVDSDTTGGIVWLGGGSAGTEAGRGGTKSGPPRYSAPRPDPPRSRPIRPHLGSISASYPRSGSKENKKSKFKD